MKENREDKKDRLLSVCEKLFLEKGYDETSVDDILTASGYSKGGFYHYFKSKDEVLSEIFDRLFKKIVEELSIIVGDEKIPAIEKLKMCLERQMNMKKPVFLPFLKYMINKEKVNYMTFKCFVDSLKVIEPLMVNIIEQGVKEGCFDVKYADETVELLMKTLVGFFDTEMELFRRRDRDSFERYLYSLEVIFTHTLGISNERIRLFGEENVDYIFSALVKE